jgi:hypothetical protein
MLQRFATAELRKMAIELYSMAKLENEREKGTVENTTKTKKIG